MGSHKSSQPIRTGRLSAGITCAALLASSLVAVVIAPSAHAKVFDPFVKRATVNAFSSVEQVGNVLETCPPGSVSIPAGVPCATSQHGNGPGNNDFPMAFVDVDGNSSTFNSSTAQVDVPADADVYYAGLYWGGNNGKWHQAGKGYGVNGEARLSCQVSEPDAARIQTATAMPDESLRDQALVGVGGSSATVKALTVQQADPTNTGQGYQAVADVTDLVSSAGTGTHTVTVADVQSARGRNCYAGWTLILVLTSKTGEATAWAPTFQNVTLFDGFARQKNGEAPTSMTIDGFVTPNGDYAAYLGDVSYEGDQDLVGDSVSINGHTLTEPRIGGTTNYYASTVTATTSPSQPDGTPLLDVRKLNPNFNDNLSFDSKVAAVDGAAVIGKGATSATIVTSTVGDTYYPGAFVFASEIQHSVTTEKLVNGRDDTTPSDPEVTTTDKPVTFTIPVTNGSDVPITNVTVSDTLDDCLTYAAKSATVDGKAVSASVKGQTVTIPIGTVAAHGGSATAALQATVKASCAGKVIDNQAMVNYNLRNGGPGTLPTNRVYVKALPDGLTIVKENTPSGTVDYGDTITYDLRVAVPPRTRTSRTSSSLTTSQVTTPQRRASAPTTYVPGSSRCLGTLPAGTTCTTDATMTSSGVVTRLSWDLGTIKAGASVHLQFKVTVDAVAGTTATIVDNTAVRLLPLHQADEVQPGPQPGEPGEGPPASPRRSRRRHPPSHDAAHRWRVRRSAWGSRVWSSSASGSPQSPPTGGGVLRPGRSASPS